MDSLPAELPGKPMDTLPPSNSQNPFQSCQCPTLPLKPKWSNLESGIASNSHGSLVSFCLPSISLTLTLWKLQISILFTDTVTVTDTDIQIQIQIQLFYRIFLSCGLRLNYDTFSRNITKVIVHSSHCLLLICPFADDNSINHMIKMMTAMSPCNIILLYYPCNQ